MNTFLNDCLRHLTQHESLAVLVSALLTSSAVICVAASAALPLRSRSARSRSAVWRLSMVALLVVGAWRLAPDMSAPVAVVEWQVEMNAQVLPIPEPVEIELPAFVLPEKTIWDHAVDFGDAWALPVWLSIATVWMLTRLLSVSFGLRALRRRSGDASASIRQIGDEAGLPRHTTYRMVLDLDSPMMTGWRAPVIWMPSVAEHWDESRLQAVLRHEAAHWKRGDWLWQWLAQAALCLWWWQPLAWMARKQLRIETEHAADDMAVTDVEHAPDYARTLVEIAAGLPSSLKSGLGVTMFGDDGVKHRVQALIRANRWRGRIGFGALTALAVVSVVLAVLVVTKVEFVPKKPVYQSIAKLVAGGKMVIGGGIEWQEQMQDFYGTIIETIESAEMLRKARERVRALNPELKDSDVDIRVTQTKGSAIFNILATGPEPKYTRIFLDALLDEFIGFRQSIREQTQGKVLSTFLKEVVNKQKVMEERNEALTRFQSAHNLVSINNDNSQSAERLSSLTKQHQAITFAINDLKLDEEDVPSAIADAETRVKAGQPLTSVETEYVSKAGETRALVQKRRTMLSEFKPGHPELTKIEEQMALAQAQQDLLEHTLRAQMKQRRDKMERQLKVIDQQILEERTNAVEIGARLGEYGRLTEEATVAKEAYQKMFERAETFQAMFNIQSDYVAIQERASAATMIANSSLYPIWKLWTPGKELAKE